MATVSIEEKDNSETEDDGGSVPADAQPLGYLRIMAQQDLEQTDYAVYEGESTVGRGLDCDLCIEACSLSRKHSVILVESGTHFIQDNGSRNKTFRGQTYKSVLTNGEQWYMVELRPNAYYELTDECDLTFADIKCKYFFGPPERVSERVSTAKFEETQAYNLAGEEEDDSNDGDERGDDEEASDVKAKGKGATIKDTDPTVPYQVQEDTDDEKEEEEEEEGERTLVIDYEPTVAYNLGNDEEDEDVEDEGDAEDNDDRTSSSPPLLEATHLSLVPTDNQSSTAGGKDADTALADTVDDDDETDVEKEGSEETDSGEGPSFILASGRTMEVDVDPTLAYDMETDIEEEEEEKEKEEDKKEEDKKEEESKEEKEKEEGEEGEEEDKEKDEEEEEKEKRPGKKGSSKSKDLKKEGEGSVGVGGESLSKKKGKESGGASIVGDAADLEDTEEAQDSEATTKEASEDFEQTMADCSGSKLKTFKSTIAASMMDFSEQGPGGGTQYNNTVILESYEESCAPNTAAAKSQALPTDDSREVKEASAEGEESEEGESESDIIFPLPSSSSKGSNKSFKEKNVFSMIAGNRDNRGKSKRGGRGRGSARGRVKKSTSKRVVEEKEEEEEEKVQSDQDEAEDPLGSSSVKSTDASPDGRPGNSRKRAGANTRRTRSKQTLNEDVGELPQDKTPGKSTGFPLTRSSRHTSIRTPQLKAGASILEESMDIDQPASPPPSDLPSPASPSLVQEASIPPSTQVRGQKSTSRGRGRGRGRGGAGKNTQSSRRDIDTVASTSAEDTPSIGAGLFKEESPDIDSLVDGGKKKKTSHEDDDGGAAAAVQDDQSDHSSSVASPFPVSNRGGRGRRKRGGAGARKRGATVKTPKKSPLAGILPEESSQTTPNLTTHAPSESNPPSVAPTSSSGPPSLVVATPEAKPGGSTCNTGDKPGVMFTGMIDRDGEKTVRDLGGELVDSVYHCTHLVTDKVRRTVKFLCCLSRGSIIVSDHWLNECAKAGRFLPAEAYLVKDKGAERQHKFSLAESHGRAKNNYLLSGYEVHLTPSIKPDREQMADIIKCSGGEATNFVSPVSPGEKVIVISCEDDLSMCKEAMDAGVPVYSAELILGGVLKQELDLKSHLMASAQSVTNGRKRKARESPVVSAKRKRK